MNHTQARGKGTSSSAEDTLEAIASPIQFEWDYREFTYVAAGNGEGEIETITYYTGGPGGTIVATRTFGYDANDDLISDETV